MFGKKKFIIFFLLMLVFLISSCGREEESVIANKEDKYYTFLDALDNTVVLDEAPERIVSLVGSYAETWKLAGGKLAGVTNDVLKEERMEITDDIKIVGTIREPNIEEILATSPDFVLLSPYMENQIKVANTLEKANITHAFFKVEYFEDYLNMLDICTDITGRKDLYEKNGLLVQKEIEDIFSSVNLTKEHSVLFVRAFSSGAKAKKDDNMTCKMLEDLGTRNIANKHETLLEDLSIEEIILEDPDYIFVTTMGDTEKAIDALKNGIQRNPAWSNLTAVKNDRYIVLPKELFHYKPNAKWGDSYRYLAEIIYPESFE